MDAEGVEVGGEDVVPSTERCRRLEDRCVDLQDQVDELLLRVEALERNRAPSGPSKAPPDGPTPRLWCDAGARYEDTAAFRADLALREAALARGLRFLPYLGRALTCMVKRRHLVRSDVASRWFCPDGIHLTALGYDKIQKKLSDTFAR
ncbi:uncharacterized protein LOC122382771 isoform X2 [Amphibalanus amphitrite]|nr:uncharacterized protein LOC122377524 isoform X2 [Amphibalanus amphitrite]XP_043224496.1 uncharacterized protein LOC122382771 isoform X2 [Amphibalanus amphitrite]